MSCLCILPIHSCKKSKNRQELAQLLKIALKNGELIIPLDDPRKYDGPKPLIDLARSVIMIKQKASGLNELFYDFIKEKMMSLDEFIEEIKKGNYQEYQIDVAFLMISSSFFDVTSSNT